MTATDHATTPRAVSRGALGVVSCAAAAITVALNIVYPLVDGVPQAAANPALRAVTAASVVTFAIAALTHAVATRGLRTAVSALVICGGIGLAAEVLGTSTGFPFGHYTYAQTLGPMAFDVPLVIGLAWLMMAWPAHVAGRLVAGLLPDQHRWRPVVVVGSGAAILASWDLFLDPQMVAAGHWDWEPGLALPGVPEIPVTNYVGWVAVALCMQAALTVATRDDGQSEHAATQHAGVPLALLLWTWLGSTLANVAFFDRPVIAAYGFVAMGPFVVLAVVGYARHCGQNFTEALRAARLKLAS